MSPLPFLFSLFLLTSCQHRLKKEGPPPEDPLVYINRPILYFNTLVDKALLEPVSVFYKYRVPHKIQQGLRNFTNNLIEPVFAINHLCQKNRKGFMVNVTRFLYNTILGLGGLIDVASHLGLKQKIADFDTTLSQWKIPRGPYLVLPIIGPSYARKVLGDYFDLLINPGIILTYNPLWVRASSTIVVRSDYHLVLKNMYNASPNFRSLYDNIYSFAIQTAPAMSKESEISYLDDENSDIF